MLKETGRNLELKYLKLTTVQKLWMEDGAGWLCWGQQFVMLSLESL